MFSNKPYFSPETDGGGEVATTETTSEVQTETAQTETTETEEGSGTEVAELEPEDDFNFEDSDAGGAEAGGSTAGTQAAAAAVVEEKVSKSEYDKVVSEVLSLKQKLSQFEGLLEQPIIKAGVEYLTAKGQGADIGPEEFYEQTFGLDGAKLTTEDLIRLEIRKDADAIGAKIEGDDLERELDSRLAAFENLSPLQQQKRQKELRDSYSEQRKQKLSTLVEEKAEAVKKQQAYWDSQQATLDSEIEALVKNGKKDFGLKMNFTQSEKDKVLAMIGSGFLKFDSNGNINVKNVIETALFAADIQAYNKVIAERAVERYKAAELAKRSKGSTLAPDNSVALGTDAPKPKQVGKLNLKPVQLSTLQTKP